MENKKWIYNKERASIKNCSFEGQSFKVPETRIRMMLESFMKYYIKTRGCFDLKVADILLWLGVEINVIGWKILKEGNEKYFIRRNGYW